MELGGSVAASGFGVSGDNFLRMVLRPGDFVACTHPDRCDRVEDLAATAANLGIRPVHRTQLSSGALGRQTLASVSVSVEFFSLAGFLFDFSSACSRSTCRFRRTAWSSRSMSCLLRLHVGREA